MVTLMNNYVLIRSGCVLHVVANATAVSACPRKVVHPLV